jgi:hypothetical protein
VSKLRGQLGFLSKSSDELLVSAVRRQDPLEADALLEATRADARRFEGFRHPAHAESAHQAVRPKVSRLTGHPASD